MRVIISLLLHVVMYVFLSLFGRSLLSDFVISVFRSLCMYLFSCFVRYLCVYVSSKGRSSFLSFWRLFIS